jgi:fatty-acyl-CoA synthase
MAFVQLRPGASLEASELLAFARENIKERAAIPVEIVLLDAIPMTAVGKVNKPPLRKEALRRVAESTCATVTGGAPIAMSIEEPAGRLTLVLQLEKHHAPFAEPLRDAFSHFAFALRIDQTPEAS